jgi:hypothetical protein
LNFGVWDKDRNGKGSRETFEEIIGYLLRRAIDQALSNLCKFSSD